MGVLASLLSALKSEIDWVISSLTFAQTASDAQPPDAPQADKAAADASAPSDAKGPEIASVVDTHTDTTPAHHAPESLSVGNYLHHIKSDAGDGAAAHSQSAILASAASDIALSHGSVTADSTPVENFSAPLSHLFEDFGSHPAASADESSLFQPASVTSYAHGGGAGGGGGGSHTPYVPHFDQIVGSDGHLKIDLIWDSSVANAPVGFKADVIAAAQYLTNNLHDTATLNITIGFGEVAGSKVPASALGESITNLNSSSYSAIADALTNKNGPTNLDAHTITYPTSDPTSGGNFWVTTAEAKALGFTVATQETISAIPTGSTTAMPLDVDGHVGFSSFRGIFNYSTQSGSVGDPITGYDFYATVLHEMTEVMGRMVFAGGNVNGQLNSYEPLDLFRFQKDTNGVVSPDVSSAKGGYFSIDGGHTDARDFNPTSGDYGDWDSSKGTDPFNASGTANVIETNSGALPLFDLNTLDAIGWNGV